VWKLEDQVQKLKDKKKYIKQGCREENKVAKKLKQFRQERNKVLKRDETSTWSHHSRLKQELVKQRHIQGLTKAIS
jgi:regulator of PEP synthase PpsR (kinase-PPPase family)